MILSVLLLLQAAPATQPHAHRAPLCAAVPRPLAGYSATALPGSANGTGNLPLDKGTRVAMLPAATVSLTATAPERLAGPGTRAGVLAFAVPTAGRYRVALGSRAWVDVIADGRPLPSVAHGHVGGCSGIEKYVEFDLGPGNYRLQLVGAGSTVDVLIAARP